MATTLTGETEVAVAQIEPRLAELWQLAGERITRASLLNFLAYVETDAAREHAGEVIRELTRRYPCRAVVLLDGPALRASISAHCHLAGGGGKQVCCEQISITGPAAQLPAAVLPLLESDLPALLWWNGNFLERPELFSRLSAVADRVLFDSSLWPKPDLPALAASIAGKNCADLSWTRLAFWRRLAAEAFEDPTGREALARVRRVVVTHGRGPGAELRALLLGSWVAAQLQWTVPEARERIQVTGDAAECGVVSLKLTGEGFEVCVCKNHGESTASATLTMPNACGLPRKRAFWPTDDVSLLSQELDQNRPHRVYERALAVAAALRG
jgi:glucose-6-phosphate dehydrogenase assembly protein OpcA